jgi:flagellar biosynthesis protein FlhG
MTDAIPLKTSRQPSMPIAALHCPNMMAVASGKGGVGKTWFAITLCHALAKQGKRVLLFDGDLGLANVDIQLGLTPERDLGNVTDGHMSLAEAVTTYAEGKFDILAGRSGSGSLAVLSSDKLAALRSELIALAKNYDHVVVDLGAGVDRAMRQLAGPAARSLVVVTDEPTSLTDAYAFIKLAHAANPQADLRVVVNMAADAKDGQKTYETLRRVAENFLNYTPTLGGIIRRDPKVRDAIRSQTPLLIRHPGSDAASDVTAIATNLK